MANLQPQDHQERLHWEREYFSKLVELIEGFSLDFNHGGALDNLKGAILDSARYARQIQITHIKAKELLEEIETRSASLEQDRVNCAQMAEASLSAKQVLDTKLDTFLLVETDLARTREQRETEAQHVRDELRLTVAAHEKDIARLNAELDSASRLHSAGEETRAEAQKHLQSVEEDRNAQYEMYQGKIQQLEQDQKASEERMETFRLQAQSVEQERDKQYATLKAQVKTAEEQASNLKRENEMLAQNLDQCKLELSAQKLEVQQQSSFKAEFQTCSVLLKNIQNGIDRLTIQSSDTLKQYVDHVAESARTLASVKGSIIESTQAMSRLPTDDSMQTILKRFDQSDSSVLRIEECINAAAEAHTGSSKDILLRFDLSSQSLSSLKDSIETTTAAIKGTDGSVSGLMESLIGTDEAITLLDRATAKGFEQSTLGIARLERSVDGVAESVVGIAESVQDTDGCIVKIRDSLQLIDTGISSIADSNKATGQNISSIKGSIITMDGNLSTIKASIKEIDGGISDVVELNETSSASIWTVEESIKAADENISNLSDTVQAAIDSISGLTEAIETTDGNLLVLKQSINSTSRAVESLPTNESIQILTKQFQRVINLCLNLEDLIKKLSLDSRHASRLDGRSAGRSDSRSDSRLDSLNPEGTPETPIGGRNEPGSFVVDIRPSVRNNQGDPTLSKESQTKGIMKRIPSADRVQEQHPAGNIQPPAKKVKLSAAKNADKWGILLAECLDFASLFRYSGDSTDEMSNAIAVFILCIGDPATARTRFDRHIKSSSARNWCCLHDILHSREAAPQNEREICLTCRNNPLRLCLRARWSASQEVTSLSLKSAAET